MLGAGKVLEGAAPPLRGRTGARSPLSPDPPTEGACSRVVTNAGPQPGDLDLVVEAIVVDAYGDDEQYVAFLTVLEEAAELPAAATLLGIPVTVTGFDYSNPTRGLVAICRGPQEVGEVSLADLAFPPDTVTAWIHAAYRHHLGLPPFPARPRPDLTWPT
jgi:hypothetical protein